MLDDNVNKSNRIIVNWLYDNNFEDLGKDFQAYSSHLDVNLINLNDFNNTQIDTENTLRKGNYSAQVFIY
jgi:hypothetical protein